MVDVNPFVLLDDPELLTAPNQPPFGLHPHHGLHVLSLIWRGTIDSRLAHEAEVSVLTGPLSASIFAGSLRCAVCCA